MTASTWGLVMSIVMGAGLLPHYDPSTLFQTWRVGKSAGRRTKGEVCYLLFVAKRPEVQSPDMSRQELIELPRKLSTMSVTGIQDFYRAAYYRCRLENEGLPPARAIQELVQAWKAM